MNILIFNQNWFADVYRQMGHTVWTCGLASHLDYQLSTPLVHIDTIIKEFIGGMQPDVILIHDNSAPIVVDGLAESKIPIVFYSVDIHHHAELHEYLSHVVDYMFVAQRDYVSELRKKASCPVEWLPLWASRYVEASSDKSYGAVFVGTLDSDLNPDRVQFFEALTKEVDVLCMTGKYWEIFPHSEIVINQTVKGDLNFRVFEAMMCGSMLLTESAPNGLDLLFTAGEHMVTYKKGDVSDASEKVQHYLKDKVQARKIAEAGREEVLAKHTIQQRAETVFSVLKEVKRSHSPKRHFGWMINFTSLSGRLRKVDTELSKRALLHALKSAEYAIKTGEVLDERTAYQFVFACCQYDIWYQTENGHSLLCRASELFPHLNLLKLARIRTLLNTGRRLEAEKIVDELGPISVERAFESAEKVVTELLFEGAHPRSTIVTN